MHIFQEWNLVHQRLGPTEIFIWRQEGLSLEEFNDKDINMEDEHMKGNSRGQVFVLQYLLRLRSHQTEVTYLINW